MIQVHGEQVTQPPYAKWSLSINIFSIDYDGVSMRRRTANSKNAASEASSIFQGHYPEFLVSGCVIATNISLITPLPAQEVLHQCPRHF